MSYLMFLWVVFSTLAKNYTMVFYLLRCLPHHILTAAVSDITYTASSTLCGPHFLAKRWPEPSSTLCGPPFLAKRWREPSSTLCGPHFLAKMRPEPFSTLCWPHFLANNRPEPSSTLCWPHFLAKWWRKPGFSFIRFSVAYVSSFH